MSLRQFLRNLFAACEDRASAEKRGMDLLHSYLSPAQRAQWSALGSFEVTGSDSGCRYIIRNSSSINIEQLGADGQCVRRWCFCPVGNLVQGDILLAQKLALECFEREALKEAYDYSPWSRQQGWAPAGADRPRSMISSANRNAPVGGTGGVAPEP